MGSGASKEELATRKVLIIGGGYAGIQAASELEKAGVPFTLVDPKEYFHHCVGALRAAVQPEYVAKIAIPFRNAFREKFVQGKVISLDIPNKKAVLEGGREVSWSHCLVAVGSLGPVPCRSTQLTVAGLEEEVRATADIIQRAEKIVIIGGGAVGFELAGEIRDKYKDKAITIVSSSEKLVCPDFAPKFYTRVNSLLEAGNVKVVVGKADMTFVKVNMIEGQTLQVGDTAVESDLVLPCTGLPPNRPEVAALVPVEGFDDKGRVKVDEFLGVEGCPGLYALGDCSNTSEHKMAAHAASHADTVVANIVLEAAGKPPRPYKQKFVGMIVPFGAFAGAGSMNGWALPNFACVKLKSADLFTAQFWTTMGLKNKMPVV